jgi:hypothetical protein
VNTSLQEAVNSAYRKLKASSAGTRLRSTLGSRSLSSLATLSSFATFATFTSTEIHI